MTDPTEKARLKELRKPRTATPGPNVETKGPCKFWAEGWCVHGKDCKFTHNEKDRGTSPNPKGKGKGQDKGKKGKPRSASPKGKGKKKQ